MKKILYYLIAIAIIAAIRFGITALLGKDCDNCGDKIYGTEYHVQGTTNVICERCAHSYPYTEL
jgi:hypothetical protein